MKSNPSTLNEFEIAILTCMANQLPSLLSVIPKLKVSNRELTGVGSFTNFVNNHEEVSEADAGPLALNFHILMPGVQHGLGALVFFDANSIAVLEIFTYGDDAWTGNWEGYALVECQPINRP